MPKRARATRATTSARLARAGSSGTAGVVSSVDKRPSDGSTIVLAAACDRPCSTVGSTPDPERVWLLSSAAMVKLLLHFGHVALKPAARSGARTPPTRQ